MSGELLSFATIEFGGGSFLGTPASDTFTEIINVTSLTLPGATRPVEDTTNLQSTAKEEYALLPEFSTMSFDINYVVTDTEHAQLLADGIATAAVPRNVKVELQNPVGGAALATYDFVGQVSGFSPTETPNAVRKASVEVTVNYGLAVT